MLDHSLTHLLAKYDVPGPRYTSYPTVPAWHTDVGAADYQHSLQALKAGESLSLYFHLPFCERLCHFCGCMQVITTDHSKSREYVTELLKEVDHVVSLLPSAVRSVSQIHFGGGTPNFLQPAELTEIMQRINQHFMVEPDAEIAIEMHPRTSTPAFCENLATLGFNRISLGVQDFDPTVQKLIHRGQSFEMTRDMVKLLRDLEFNSFNFDLIYGLPGQNLATWNKTLEQVLSLDPDRLAVYSYAHVPWMRPVQRSFKDMDLPSPEIKLRLFETAYQFFCSQAYHLIGMDHFAKMEDELTQALLNGSLHRNFMGYTTRANAHQIGFGVSSISFVNGNYFQNQKELPKYYETIRSGELASFRGYLLNKDDHIRRDLITQIMCQTRFKSSDFAAKWGINFAEYFGDNLNLLQSFVADDLLDYDGNYFRVKNYGFLFLRNMAMLFDAHLAGIKAGATTPVFSRTV